MTNGKITEIICIRNKKKKKAAYIQGNLEDKERMTER